MLKNETLLRLKCFKKVKNLGQNFSLSIETFGSFGLEERFILWKAYGNRRVYIQNSNGLRKQIINEFHKKAYFGSIKVYAEAARHIYCSNMFEDIQCKVACCETLLASIVERKRKAVLVFTNDIPKRCCENITADFLAEFPRTNRGLYFVLLLLNKLSKRVVLIAMNKSSNLKEVAHLFESDVLSKFGAPEVLTSDRHPKFTVTNWKTIMKSESIKLNMATTGHPETKGKSERSIQTLISVLRPVIQSETKQWDKFPPNTEFEVNPAKQESKKLSPFQVDIGRIAKTLLTRNLSTDNTKKSKL